MNESSLPIAPLTAEHRLTERMISVMQWRVADMESVGTVDIGFIDAAVEFLRTYADRCHHGKEEDILFRELARKPLSAEHRRMLDELVADHVFARTTTGRLVEARNRYAAGEASALDDLAACLHMFVEFYPKHIAKEEHWFFGPVMSYFTAAELSRMLSEVNEFDRRFAQVMYGKVVEAWERMPDAGSTSSGADGQIL
jgi:hemerythrin-like domain-containing protein